MRKILFFAFSCRSVRGRWFCCCYWCSLFSFYLSLEFLIHFVFVRFVQVCIVWSARVSLNWKISYLSVQHAWVYFFHLFFCLKQKDMYSFSHIYYTLDLRLFCTILHCAFPFVNVLSYFWCIVWINACETEYSLQEPTQVKICNSRLIPLLSNVRFLLRFDYNFAMTIQFSDTNTYSPPIGNEFGSKSIFTLFTNIWYWICFSILFFIASKKILN